jgi:hypothetical protein
MLKSIATLSLVAGMLAAAWFVLRSPDVGQAAVFFTAGTPSLAAGEAVMSLLGWLVVVVAACATLLSVFRGLWQSRFRQHPGSLASLCLVVGFLLLAIGAIQRALPSESVCCGSGSQNVREAMQLAR